MEKGDLKPFTGYLQSIEKTLADGHATEGSHYPALKSLLESLSPGLSATSLPDRIACGAPDFRLTRGPLTIGYVEAKPVGTNLAEIELGKGEDGKRFKRYLEALPNLVLTDFLEFRWYAKGKRRALHSLGSLLQGKVKSDKAGKKDVAALLEQFLTHEAEGVGTAQELAQWMARLSHRLRDIIVGALNKEQAPQMLRSLHQAFCDTIVPGLTVEQFADMFAQTVAYGLFAARYHAAEGAPFTRQGARDMVPRTNPFLRNIFDHIVGAQLPEILAPEVEDLVQLLAKADMSAILQDFARRPGREDPVVYLYEAFLHEYDPNIQELRGVYYTPLHVVSYIVRSIDHLLRTRFNLPFGLSDAGTVKYQVNGGERESHRVLILDPACGTATFLYEVVNLIRQSMIAKEQQGMWDGYVASHLLPRLFGFELMMAPYAVAHLKLERQLLDTGYKFQGDQRLGIYLTNTLEEAIKKSEVVFGQFIAQEANAAAEIKRDKPIMVVLGNPPYSGISANASQRELTDPNTGKKRRELTWVGRLVEDYKKVDGQPLRERKHWLQDDYVKFIRFGQWRIEKTGQGILGFVTNHAYLDNPTFRGMRQSLMNTFTEIYLLDLHGNTRKREVAPDGSPDKNVFDIQQGVAIGIFVREPGKPGPAKVYHADLWGTREGKYRYLSETDVALTSWSELSPTSPFYFLVPREETLRGEYEQGWKVTEMFPVNSTGIITARDHFVIDFHQAAVRERIKIFRDAQLDDATVKDRLSLSENYAWRVSQARKQLMAVQDWESYFTEVLYRPFDIRPVYYHPSVVWRTRKEVMRHMAAGENVGLVTVRQVAEGIFNHAFVSCSIVESRITLSNKGIGFLFPLYLYPSEQEIASGLYQAEERRPNLNPDFVKALSEKLGLQFIEDGRGNLEETFGPQDIFHYAYAVLHSPTYRSRYAEFLKIDFPHLPITSDKKLFADLAAKGAGLTALHLLESPVLESKRTEVKFDISGSNSVEKVVYDEVKRRVYINKSQYFEGLPPEVWNFLIGGYQVLEKWLKERRGRKLTYQELEHYQKVVVAVKETIRLMEEIDARIPSWPLE